MTWLVKCALSAVAIIGLLWSVPASVRGDAEAMVLSTDAGNLLTAKRYVTSGAPDVVLVGSSLTFRLSETYFLTRNLRNLAFPGGSSLTGLAIVDGAATAPPVVLIEANILTRAIDEGLVMRALEHKREPLRIVRWLGAMYQNHQSARQVESAEQLLSQPASDVTGATVPRPEQSSITDAEISSARSNLVRLQRLVDDLRRRGSTVLLYELPYEPELMTARYAQVVGAMIHAGFPAPSSWLPLDYPAAELRWSDGEHLDARSAVIMARSIDKAIARIRQ